MLSYQHGYHAGNVADVHKHAILILLLKKLGLKEPPFCVLDTHAGRGGYPVGQREAPYNKEVIFGAERLWQNYRKAEVNGGIPVDLLDYWLILGHYNQALDLGSLQYYPGSPQIISAYLRPQDRGVFIEKHPQEVSALRQTLRGIRDKKIAVHERDAYEGLLALTPPLERRGLIFMDPSYEQKQEYVSIPQVLKKVLVKWPNAIICLWYPILATQAHRGLLQDIQQFHPDLWIDELPIIPGKTGLLEGRLLGSGIALINRPYFSAPDPLTCVRKSLLLALE